MLSEVFAAGLGYVIGWAALRSFIRQTGLTFVVFTSLPAGAAIWVFCAVWLQALPILYSPTYPSVIACVIAAWLSFKSHLAVEKYEVVAFVVGLCMISVLIFFNASICNRRML